MELQLVKLATALILPPGGNLMVALVGFIAFARARRFAVVCVVLAWGSLYAFSIHPIAGALERGLQVHPPLTDPAKARAEAIVVLGGGRYRSAPEYGGVDTVGDQALQRVRYGAYLHRRTRLPILVSGGSVLDADADSEAELMATALREEFGVPVRWLESASHNTAENARYSAEQLQRDGISRIVLVTHAIHMPRSVEAFERTGLAVTPGPTLLPESPSPAYSWQDFRPSAHALRLSSAALHEYLGRLWYRIRYRD